MTYSGAVIPKVDEELFLKNVYQLKLPWEMKAKAMYVQGVRIYFGPNLPSGQRLMVFTTAKGKDNDAKVPRM